MVIFKKGEGKNTMDRQTGMVAKIAGTGSWEAARISFHYTSGATLL